MNNLREILDSLRRKGGFVVARAPYGSPWQSRFANQRFANCVGESQSLRDCFVASLLATTMKRIEN